MPSHESYHKLFQAIVDSLPRLLAQIPAENDEDRYRQVSEILHRTSGPYQKLQWDEAANQCAYVFKFFVKHSHLVYELMCRQSHHFELVWKHLQEIKVCSIGGGPGSDVAGMIEFLEGTSFGVSLCCSVLDLFPQWENSWKVIYQNLPSRLNAINVGYHKFNMVDNTFMSPENCQRISTADLVTFVKSFSTVCSVKSNEVQLYFQVLPNIMNCIKHDGFVLFIDSSSDAHFNARFKEIAVQRGLCILVEDVSKSEFPGRTPTNIEMYCERFHYKPMRRCKVTVYLFQKSLPCQMSVSEPNPSQDIQIQNIKFDMPFRSYSAKANCIPGTISLERNLVDNAPSAVSSVESTESTVQSK